MSFFNRKKPVKVEAQHDSRVEVVVHKEATKEVVAQAKKANETLAKLLEQNGFTIKIFLAAGGKTKDKVATNEH